MALIATSAGWHGNPDTGGMEFCIILKAERREDVPDIVVGAIWEKTPLRLTIDETTT